MKELETLYRLYDIKAKRYYSTGKKSIWKSENWAVQAVPQGREDDFELHTIKQVIDSKISVHALVKEWKDNIKKRKEAEILQQEICRFISNKFGMKFYDIEKLYKANLLSSNVTIELAPYFDELNELNKIIK